jgi:hypothetical protein
MNFVEFIKKSWLKMIIGMLVLLFFWYVWPTPYRYDHISRYLVRMNRFTGKTEVLQGYGGWIPVESNTGGVQPEAAPPAPAQLPMSSSQVLPPKNGNLFDIPR